MNDSTALRHNQLTENQTIRYLVRHLENEKWTIGENFRLSHQRGIDAEARKGNTVMLIEVKGAKAHKNAPTKKRKKFSGGQINAHFGAAIVKVLKLQNDDPKALIAIAHPDDAFLRKHLTPLIPYLKMLGCRHYWVSKTAIIQL